MTRSPLTPTGWKLALTAMAFGALLMLVGALLGTNVLPAAGVGIITAAAINVVGRSGMDGE